MSNVQTQPQSPVLTRARVGDKLRFKATRRYLRLRGVAF
jgi:hypothetical protein